MMVFVAPVLGTESVIDILPYLHLLNQFFSGMMTDSTPVESATSPSLGMSLSDILESVLVQEKSGLLPCIRMERFSSEAFVSALPSLSLVLVKSMATLGSSGSL